MQYRPSHEYQRESTIFKYVSMFVMESRDAYPYRFIICALVEVVCQTYEFAFEGIKKNVKEENHSSVVFHSPSNSQRQLQGATRQQPTTIHPPRLQTVRPSQTSTIYPALFLERKYSCALCCPTPPPTPQYRQFKHPTKDIHTYKHAICIM